MESTFFLKNAVALTSSLESEKPSGLIRYNCEKRSMLSFFKSGGSGLYFFYGVKNPRLTSPNQSVEHMKNILSLNLSTTGFWFRIFGYGICISYLANPLYFCRSSSKVNFLKIGKFYIYLLTNKN
jgi:hypothetical protein